MVFVLIRCLILISPGHCVSYKVQISMNNINRCIWKIDFHCMALYFCTAQGTSQPEIRDGGNSPTLFKYVFQDNRLSNTVQDLSFVYTVYLIGIFPLPSNEV